MWAPMPHADALPIPLRTLDTSGLLCPIPIVKTAVEVKGLADGDVLLVIATDAGIAVDMPMWCKAMGHEHLATFEDGGQLEELPAQAAQAAAPRAATER